MQERAHARAGPLENLVDGIIGELEHDPPDLLSLGEAQGEAVFARRHKDSYVRTLRDVSEMLGPGERSVLEIGAFMGVVSIGLKRLGYAVDALDIPEFFSDPHVKNYYSRSGVATHPANLRHARLPFESGRFDAVVMCETLEHLNFNPIPILAEIGRVLKGGGYIYVAMPNLARLSNRIKLLIGRQIYNPVSDLVLQLSPRHNMIVALHWREYTMAETMELLRLVGFEIEKRYFHAARYATTSALRAALFAAVPAWRPTQVVIGRKASTPALEIWRTEANS